MSRPALFTLLAAFALSVAVRWPLVDRPLSAHHEYCTAFTLIALTNWWDDGFATHHGMPSGGFIREGERLYPPNDLNRNERAVGLYYFSHPPLAYDLPYALFVAMGTAPNVAGLQWMNIIFHLVTAFALFHVVRSVIDQRGALYAAVLYLFLPATLWFHGNAYMSDMFVQVPWVLHLVFAMRVLTTGARPSCWTWVGHAFTLFLVLYTSWLGVFAAATGVFVAALRWWKDRNVPVLTILGITVLAFAAAFGLTAWRFLQVIDADALLRHFSERFAVRGSLGVHGELMPLLRQIVVNYRIGFLPVVLLVAILLIHRMTDWRAKENMFAPPWLFILLTGLPVLLDHALLLQYAAHDFAALKAAPLLCGVAGWLLAQISPGWSRVALGLTCLAGVLYFYRTNPPPGHDGGRSLQERDLGSFIAANAAPDEVVFGQGVSNEPQVAWYARRNILGTVDTETARAFLRERGLQRGVVISEEEGVLRATHITH